MQQRHTSAKKALFSNLHISRQTHTASPMSLSPVDRMCHTEQASSHANNCVFADADHTLGRMCNVTITVDEARRVYVHVFAVVDVNRPFNQRSDARIGIIAAFARAENAVAVSLGLE